MFDANTRLSSTAATTCPKMAFSCERRAVNAKDNNGAVPLHCAALRGRSRVAELLLASGADVNVEANNGETPFYSASRARQQAVEEAMSVSGALRGSAAIRKTPDHDAVAQLLKQHGGH